MGWRRKRGFNLGCGQRNTATAQRPFLPASYASSNVTLNLGGLITGVIYHYRAGAFKFSRRCLWAGPDLYRASDLASGDVNGDAVVDLNELNSALSNYWSASSLYMTNQQSSAAAVSSLPSRTSLAGNWASRFPRSPHFGLTSPPAHSPSTNSSTPRALLPPTASTACAPVERESLNYENFFTSLPADRPKSARKGE